MSYRGPRHGRSWWLPGDCGFPERVVAVVDDHLCSVASVWHAASIAESTSRPLTVALRHNPPPWLSHLLPMPAVPLSDTASEAELFAAVAGVVRPALSWDFRVLGPAMLVDDLLDADSRRRGLVVTTGHSGRPRSRVLRRRRSSGLRPAPLCRDTTPRLIVGCGQECEWRGGAVWKRRPHRGE